MPYTIEKVGSGYKVENEYTGRTYSKSPLPLARAEAQRRAIYASENGYSLRGGKLSSYNMFVKRLAANMKKEGRQFSLAHAASEWRTLQGGDCERVSVKSLNIINELKNQVEQCTGKSANLEPVVCNHSFRKAVFHLRKQLLQCKLSGGGNPDCGERMKELMKKVNRLYARKEGARSPERKMEIEDEINFLKTKVQVAATLKQFGGNCSSAAFDV